MNLTFSGVLTLALLAMAIPAAAQETGSDALADQSGNEASVTESAADTDPATVREQEIDELEPGVPSQVLVSDVQRRPASGVVMDELDLGRTEITGNQELPTVLYIVPWQKSDPGDLMGRPANTLLDEVLAPVDRGEFVRQVDYYDELFDSAEEQ